MSLFSEIKKYKVATLVLPVFTKSLGGAAPIALSFVMQRQLQSQWCWAATSASVSHFYNALSTWTQCLVAEQIMGSNCCVNPGPCNQSWYLDKALAVTNNFVALNSTLSFQAVENELNAGRVIGARVGWHSGGGHFMVIYGCDTSNGINYLSIDDPIYGKSRITEAAFLAAYQGSGSWTHSYTTKT
jgi:hypothetical protein